MVAREAKIWGSLNAHYNDALKLYPNDRIVGVFLQGSQNYNLDDEYSDIDTKVILTPSFKELAMNSKPVSTTHVRDNEEHFDAKDVRLYFDTFRKSNLNFVEILFTDYYIINPMYQSFWNWLLSRREEIARMNPYRAIKSMQGIAKEKYHAMEHKYPSKLHLIEKYGYDGKQLSHLVRVYEFLYNYIHHPEISYKENMIPKDVDMIKGLKREPFIPLNKARKMAKFFINEVDNLVNYSLSIYPEENENEEVLKFIREVQYNIMTLSVQNEFGVMKKYGIN